MGGDHVVMETDNCREQLA